MKNVLQICHYAAPYDGNFIYSLTQLNSHLESIGSRNIYLFPDRLKESKSAWLKNFEKTNSVYYFSGKLLDDIHLIKTIITAANIGTVSLHFGDNELNLATFIATKLKRVKCFKHYHNHIIRNSNFKQFLAQRMFKDFTLIAVGDSVYENLKEKQPKCSIRTVKNAIDFSRLDVFKKINKSDLRIDESSIVCFMSGFDFKRKGVDLALKAIDDLNKNGKNLVLTIVSADEQKKKKEIMQVLDFVPEWVKILPPRNEIATYYNFADIFLSPSREEGLCYSVMEAAYCGNLVVLSDCEGLGEIKIPNMFRFKSEDVDELKKAIEMAILHINDYDVEKVASKRYVEAEYSIDTWVNTMMTLYKRYL